MKTEIYKRIIQTIYNITGDDKIRDIIHSTNDDHIECKEWLASELIMKFWMLENPKILVGGG